MSKIARKTQLVFGSTAGGNQIAQFGSLAAGSPVFSTDPDVIQGLSNYLVGWFGGAVGAYSPTIEDMNALCYLFARQIAYGFQSGIPEWDTGTTYYIGSFASDGVGGIYASLIDSNTGQALSDASKWRKVTGSASVTLDPSTQSPYTLTAADNGKTFLVSSNNAAMTFILPAAIASFSFQTVDKDQNAATNNITIQRAASELLEGVGANFTEAADGGAWKWLCDGTNWYLTT